MAIEKWTHSQREVLFEHPRMTLVEDVVDLPDGTSMNYLRTAPSSKNSVAIIALNENGQMLVQREYSYPPDEIMWQLPGGAMEKDEEIIEAGLRELSEESGYTAKNAKVIGFYFADNRRSDSKQYVVACTDLVEQKAQPDQGEFIETHWLAIEEIDAKISSGEITNISFLAALMLWKTINS